MAPFYAGAVIFAFATLITVPVFRIFIDKKSLASLGYDLQLPRNSPFDVSVQNLIAIAMAMAILGIGWLTLYLLDDLEYHGAIFSPLSFLTSFIFMCIIAVAEESVFRGYLLHNLMDSFKPWVALLISALIFAFLHSGNPEAGVLAIINIFLAGVFIGQGYIYTRNLWFAIFFHLSWNFLQGPVLGFPVSGLELPALLQVTITGEDLLTGGKFGFEGSIIQSLLFLVANIILFFYYRRRSPKDRSVTTDSTNEQALSE
ncbi:lysostaphin resistance A-like protein [Flavitalea antarctica]